MEKFKVYAACSLGASIAFFIGNLSRAAKELGYDVDFEPHSVDETYGYELNGYDLILIAPQVRFCASRIRNEVNNRIPVVEIEKQQFNISSNGEREFKELILPYIEKKNHQNQVNN